MRESQTRHHTDCRERKEHRPEEKQETECLAVARRPVRVKEIAFRELDRPGVNVIRTADIARCNRIVALDDRVHDGFDV